MSKSLFLKVSPTGMIIAIRKRMSRLHFVGGAVEDPVFKGVPWKRLSGLNFLNPGSLAKKFRLEVLFFISVAIGFFLIEKLAVSKVFQLNWRSGKKTELIFVLSLAFFWVCSVAFAWSHYFVRSPVLRLVSFLESLKADQDLPNKVPKLGSVIIEQDALERSLGALFQRLREDRALTLRRLLMEKRRADIIAASISDGVMLLRDDEILYVNPAAEKILGLRPRSFLQPLKLNVDNSQLNKNSVQAFVQAVSSSLPVDFVFESDNGRFFYLFQAFSLSDALITEVENSGPFLEAVDADHFQANILVLAQDVTLVKESQVAKSHFLGTLSHEIRTPVTSLTMATHLLRKSVDQIPDPNQRSLIVTCSEDVDRLRRLLNDLMTVSSFDTLTQRLEIQSIDLGKLISHSVQTFQVHAKEKGIELLHETQSRGRSIMVEMDAAKIAWAVSNLITNALRHTPRKGRVKSSVVVVQDFAEVKICDSGPGIEPYRQGHIFDKFNPYYDLRVARSGSIGVGLAIAREIVVAHGGSIWVISEQGHGAEFCFTLPLRRSKPHLSPDESIVQPQVIATDDARLKNS